jgi:DNA-directed RNA polymerase specialized sigma24 family protein
MLNINIPGPDGPNKFKSIKGQLPSNRTPEERKMFEGLLDRHHSHVFYDVAELTGLSDAILVEEIVMRVFLQLWDDNYNEKAGIPPIRALFKITVHLVLAYLEEMGNRERIQIVQDILTVELLWCNDLIFPEDTKQQSRFKSLLSALKRLFHVPLH